MKQKKHWNHILDGFKVGQSTDRVKFVEDCI